MHLHHASALVVALLVSACNVATGSAPTLGALPGADHVHALRAADDGSLLLGLHGALWRSEDGSDWEPQGLDGQDAMAVGVVAEGAPLLVGGHDVLARSSDGGETFEMLTPDLPSLDIHALAQAPGDPDVVYVYVVGTGVFRSSDAGDTWAAAARLGPTLPGDLTSMAVDPRDADTLLVGSSSVGTLRSTDGATTFTRTSEWGTGGLGFGPDGELLAATVRGIDASPDGGTSWSNIAPTAELPGQPLAVAIGPRGTRWVVTDGPRTLLRDDGDGFTEVARA